MMIACEFDLSTIDSTAHRGKRANRGIRYFLPDQSSLASVRIQKFVKTITKEQRTTNNRLCSPKRKRTR